MHLENSLDRLYFEANQLVLAHTLGTFTSNSLSILKAHADTCTKEHTTWRRMLCSNFHQSLGTGWTRVSKKKQTRLKNTNMGFITLVFWKSNDYNMKSSSSEGLQYLSVQILWTIPSIVFLSKLYKVMEFWDISREHKRSLNVKLNYNSRFLLILIYYLARTKVWKSSHKIVRLKCVRTGITSHVNANKPICTCSCDATLARAMSWWLQGQDSRVLSSRPHPSQSKDQIAIRYAHWFNVLRAYTHFTSSISWLKTSEGLTHRLHIHRYPVRIRPS